MAVAGPLQLGSLLGQIVEGFRRLREVWDKAPVILTQAYERWALAQVPWYRPVYYGGHLVF